MKQYLYHKNEIVLEIDNNYNCIIHNYDMLPLGLRYKDINYDDIMHGWLESRNMSLGRTNAKALLKACGISQRNSYAIAKLYHFASVSDCYWLKDENENVTWEDINFYTNKPEELITKTALFGEHKIIPAPQKIHTPEYSTQGLTAKAWVKETNNLYLYKIAKKELAASYILSKLNISHIPYEKADIQFLLDFTDNERFLKIKENNELIVKCPCITNDKISIVTWEDFCIYCDRHKINPYEEIINIDAEKYYQMLVADYILGNEDRHEGNWGLFIDNNTGNIIGLHPLMDHDHAFSLEKVLPSQTTDLPLTQEQAAEMALNHININFDNINLSYCPKELSKEQWEKVVARISHCIDYQKNHKENDKEIEIDMLE